MSRVYYDNSKYMVEKAKLPSPDGVHCVICGGVLPKFKHKYCSDDCFSRWYVAIGGIHDWSILRKKVLKRDHYTCQECVGGEPNIHNTYMEAHHVKPIHDGGEEFNPDNCITLCRVCHKKKHTKIGRIKCQHKTLEHYEEKYI